MVIVVLGVLLVIAAFITQGLHSQTSEKTNLKPLAWTLRIVGVLAIVGGLLTSTVTLVPAGFRGVKLTFGATSGILPEGLNFIMPGINSVVLLEARTQKDESQATAASRDLQVVTTTVALNYRIDPGNVDKLYRSVGSNYKTRIIDPAVQESLKAVTANYTAEDLIRLRPRVKNEVELQISERLQSYNIIVEPAGLSITNFDFSPEFNKAIESKQVAQQEAEKQKYLLQRAELEKKTEVTKAEGRSKAAMLNAEALKISGGSLVIAREWIEKWDGKLPSVSAGANGFMIDLSTLLKQQ